MISIQDTVKIKTEKTLKKEVEMLSNEELIEEMALCSFYITTKFNIMKDEYKKRKLFNKENNLKLAQRVIDTLEDSFHHIDYNRFERIIDFTCLKENYTFLIDKEIFRYILTNIKINEEIRLVSISRKVYYFFSAMIEENNMTLKEIDEFIRDEKGEINDLARYCAVTEFSSYLSPITVLYPMLNHIDREIAKEVLSIYIRSIECTIKMDKLLKLNNEVIINEELKEELDSHIKSCFMLKRLKNINKGE